MVRSHSDTYKGAAESHDIIIFDIDTVSTEKVEQPKKESLELVQELILAKDIAIDTSISSVLMKPILDYCVPIIKSIPKVMITNIDVEKYSAIKAEAKSVADNGIPIVFDRDIICQYNGAQIGLVAGQMALVTGLLINHNIIPNKQLDIFDYLDSGKKYNIREIIKAGLFGVFNCYKNYFFSPYLGRQFSISKTPIQIEFSQKTPDNNEKLHTFIELCNSVNTLYSTTYHLSLHAITDLERINVTKRDNISKSNRAELDEWLIKNKLATPKQLTYLTYNVEVLGLIDKIKWHDSSGIGKDYINKLQQTISAAVDANENKIKYIRDNIDVANKKNISYNKFGTSNMYGLTAAQRKNISQEYEQQKAKKSSGTVYPLIIELQKAIDQSDTKMVSKVLDQILDNIGKDAKSKLEKQFESSDVLFTGLVRINSADSKNTIAEICPHIIEYANKLRNGGYIADIENAIANKYGAQDSSIKAKRDQRDTYCKLCGALLAEYDDEEIAFKEKDSYIMTAEDDEIFSMIKRELQYVLSYYMHLPADSPIPKSGILDLLASLIRIKILEIQADLIKIKTMTDNEMWILLNIYIYIYIFAVFTQFVFINPDVLQFKQARVFVEEFTKKSKAAIQQDIDNEPKNTTVVGNGGKTRSDRGNGSKTKSDRGNGSKTKSDRGNGGKTKSDRGNGGKIVNIAKSSKDILTDLLKRKQGKENLERLINHALELIKKVKFADINSSKYITITNIKELFLAAYKWTMTLNYNVESVEDMVGKKESDFKQTDIEQYTVVKYFELYGNLGRKFEKIEQDFKDSIPLYSTIELDKKAPNESKLVYDYIVGEKYLLKPVPGSQELNNIINRMHDERKEEIIRNKPNKIMKLRPFVRMPNYGLKDVKLNLPYELVATCGKSCTRTYFYQSRKSKPIEYTKKEIVEWLESKNEAKLKDLYAMTCLGVKCICKPAKNQQVILFYKYYEQFCPKGELHEYNEKKCKKCSITEDIIKSHDSDYYDKYKAEYAKQRKKETSNINKVIMQQVDSERQAIKQFNKLENANSSKFAEWKISTKEVAELAKLVPIKNLDNLFRSIGLFEGQEYKLLETNKVQPYNNADNDAYKNQAISVHNYILYVYRCYYSTKNSEYLVKLPPDLKTILTKSGQNNKDFAKKLTDLDDTYVDKYDWYNTQKLGSDALANFCIVSLANVFLAIYDIFKKAKLDKFGETWIQFYIAKIIGYERYLCVVKLKNLKPLARFQDDEETGDSKFEDNDMVHSKANSENPSVLDEEIEEAGNEFANDDVDVERDEDEDNMDNTFVTVD